MQKVAIITGGSKGIGFALCHQFLKEGFLVVSISRSLGQLEELIPQYDKYLKTLFYDFSKKEEVLKCAEQIMKEYSQIDVLVNNAGVFIPGKISEEQDDAFELQMALNVAAPYYFTKKILSLLEKTPYSYIFNICSTASITAYINGGSYCISKHALLGFSRVLREDCKSKKINVSAILPGATLTDSWNGTDLPKERFIRPEDIASIIYTSWLNRAFSCTEEIIIRPCLGDI